MGRPALHRSDYCDGHIQTLYVRKGEQGKLTSIGSLCLGCGATIWKEDTMRELDATPGSENVLSRWQARLGEVRMDIASLLRDREIHRRFIAITASDDELKANVFPQQIEVWYSRSVMLAIRRHTSSDARTASLRSLLEDIAQNIESFDFETLKGRYEADGFDESTASMLARRVWARLPGSAGMDMSAEDVRHDVEQLQLLARSTRRLGARVLQGLSADDSGELDLSLEVENALDILKRLTQKYSARLLGLSGLPEIEDLGWEAVFDRPWRALPKSKWQPPYLPGESGTPTDALPMTEEMALHQPCFVLRSSLNEASSLLTLDLQNVGKDTALNTRVFIPLYGPFGATGPVQPGMSEEIGVPLSSSVHTFRNFGGAVQVIVEFQDPNGGNRYRQYARASLVPSDAGSIHISIDALGLPYRVQSAIIAEPPVRFVRLRN